MAFRSQTIRLAIFISTFITAVIIIFQLVWLRKIYYLEQKEFNLAIAKVVRGFYEDIKDPIHNPYNLNQLITNPNEQSFFVQLHQQPLPKDSVRFFLQQELEDENIFTDCYAGVYNGSRKNFDFTLYLPSATSAKNEMISLPSPGDNGNQLVLYFPHRDQYILSRMNVWIISSIIILIVLILLGGSIYYLYRQKFLNEVQKDFVNNFTHEFKTPVSVINLAADVLTNPATHQKPEKLAKYAAIVQYQGIYLQDQIERLLRHAYSETNLLHLQKKKVNLHETIEESLNNLQTLIGTKQAVVEQSLNAEDSLITADKGYIQIVVTNLIENALKYSTDPKITISTWNNDSEIFLSIKDNGKGIEKKYWNKIFKKFYRVPNGEQVSVRGFGLGLAFVKKIVKAHHGKIHVESIPGVGSDFRISLPVN